jgi:flavin reductase (DIM6/NTAB) family NADH-FMN oxidoreductase RutF
MQFDVDRMAATDRYELLLGTVVPRPIALVTTVSIGGATNAAPYSLFNVMGHDPAVVMISVLAHPDGRLKDTANNIGRALCWVSTSRSRCWVSLSIGRRN